MRPPGDPPRFPVWILMAMPFGERFSSYLPSIFFFFLVVYMSAHHRANVHWFKAFDF